jgi:pimeloyl-CoA dehydrogenase small subunit
MDFDFTEEQRLLKQSVDRVVADAYGDFERRKTYRAEPDGWSAALWTTYAELGLLGLPFAEAEGGFGGGPVETMIVMEAFGRGLVVEPYLATVVLGGGFLRLGGNAEQKAAYIPKIAEGSLRFAFAHTERQARYNLSDIAANAREDGDGFVLNGRKSVVIHGDSADFLVVSARTSCNRRDPGGISLFLVPADAHGLTRRGYPTQDGLRAAAVDLENVRVGRAAVIGEIGKGLPLIEQVVDLGIAAIAAEAVGAMEALLWLTVDYLKTRKQFGVAIGSFQALQHRAADMLVHLEQARSMTMYAATMAEESDPARRQTALAMVKLQVNDSARAIGQEAIQLHGGIAMTDEYKAGHYFKRLTVIQSLFGDSDYQLSLLTQSNGLIEAA